MSEQRTLFDDPPQENRRRISVRDDLSGQTFRRLTVIRQVENIGGYRAWLCVCSCGNETIATTAMLRAKGGKKSCGCLRREIAKNRAAAGVWNKGKTYAIPAHGDGERVYAKQHSWRKAVLRAKGNKCEECGWDKAPCDVHHKIARSRGGKNVISNGRVVCPNCHRVEHESCVRRRGEQVNTAKLTEDDVREIRRIGYPLRQHAERFGVSEALVGAILKGKVWKHV